MHTKETRTGTPNRRPLLAALPALALCALLSACNAAPPETTAYLVLEPSETTAPALTPTAPGKESAAQTASPAAPPSAAPQAEDTAQVLLASPENTPSAAPTAAPTPAQTPKPAKKPAPKKTARPTAAATAACETPPPAAPTPEPTPEPTKPPASGGETAQESRMVGLVNGEREAAGLPALSTSGTLRAGALKHSNDMSINDFFSHTSPTNGSFSTRVRAAGVGTSAAENIAMYGSVTSAHDALMKSKGHRDNIMNPEYTKIGIGIVYNESRKVYYITQWFSK